MAITKVIDPIPEAPQRGVDTQEQFDQKADAFLKRLETLDDDLNEWKDQCNQTQTEINNAESQAYQHKENARKWASEAEDTQVDDGEHTGYSAYHYSKKAEAEKNEAYNHKENARKWASEDEDTQVDDGEYQGYSAYHWAQKAAKGESFVATSSTSHTIGTGVKTFQLNEIQTKAFTKGTPVRIAYTDDPANYMDGQVIDYDKNNQTLTVNIGATGGSGTFDNWSIGLAPQWAPINLHQLLDVDDSASPSLHYVLIGDGSKFVVRLIEVDDLNNCTTTTKQANKIPLTSENGDLHNFVNYVPVGTIIAFAADTPPDGFLECNGAEISRTDYADLFAVIGTTFGAGDGSTTFNLPDLRGEFIRGWDHGRGVDTDRTFGSWQEDQLKEHSHLYRDMDYTYPYSDGYDGADGHFVDKSTSLTGGSETRPRNIALMFCIKY